jgi:uncharacterized protein DUF6788
MPAPIPPHRSQQTCRERTARSQLRKRFADAPWLRGSLVRMARSCGKPGCHCAQGEKHVSLYLAIRAGRKRTMIYLPPELEERARTWVESSQEIDRLLDVVSQACLDQLLREKRQATQRRKVPPSRKGKPS